MEHAFILVSDYNLDVSKIIVSHKNWQECFAVDKDNNIQYIELFFEETSYDGLSYNVLLWDDTVGYIKEAHRDLVFKLRTEELKLVSCERPIDGGSWNFDDLPRSIVYHIPEHDIGMDRDMRTILINLEDELRLILERKLQLTDEDVFYLIDKVVQDYDDKNNKETRTKHIPYIHQNISEKEEVKDRKKWWRFWN